MFVQAQMINEISFQADENEVTSQSTEESFPHKFNSIIKMIQ